MIDCNKLMERIQTQLMSDYQIYLHEADVAQLHNAIGTAVMAEIADTWRTSRLEHGKTRRAYYISAEYLVGRMVFNNLYCLGILDNIKSLLYKKGADINTLEEIEDVALGNGGLGRLAACYLDSAATIGVPLDGYGLRYRFGLFKQSFSNGFQLEKADNWQSTGDPWSKRREDRALTVEFADTKVRAVPYDMPIIGYNSDNYCLLRLWQSEAIEEFDFDLFNEQEYALAVREKNAVEDITRVLYPNDSTYDGKRLRLKQQYFLASASIQDMIRRYKRLRGNDLSGFAAHAAVQLNDTHPTVAIPELIRLLTADGMDFNTAFDIAAKTFNYTNHTIMNEALERWDVNLFCSVVPKLYDIIVKIDERLDAELRVKGRPDDVIHRMRIIDSGCIHMARLATFVSSYVNGVAKIHTEILKHGLLSDWYEAYPERFKSVTNGITQRRWLGLCNPELTAFIEKKLGSNAFLTDLTRLDALKGMLDSNALCEFAEIKREKKRRLAAYINEHEGVNLPTGFIFDVQIKRMHEYKRQLLNALSIVDIYFSLKDGSLRDFTPTAFIFGAKAAPGYARAKGVIKYINEIARRINNDPDMADKMRVVFVQNYNCSYAEHIIPAADISEQISPAGTEASGTGNMKFMLNGTVTLGTYDGANVEIVEQAGLENNYIFGATVTELEQIKDSYSPKALYDCNPRIHRALDTLVNGTFSDDNTGMFAELYNSLLYGANYHRPDNYFLLKDFDSYMEAKLRANREYRDTEAFSKKCLINTASAGFFSSDRAVLRYANEIWHVPVIKK